MVKNLLQTRRHLRQLFDDKLSPHVLRLIKTVEFGGKTLAQHNSIVEVHVPSRGAVDEQTALQGADVFIPIHIARKGGRDFFAQLDGIINAQSRLVEVAYIGWRLVRNAGCVVLHENVRDAFLGARITQRGDVFAFEGVAQFITVRDDGLQGRIANDIRGVQLRFVPLKNALN